jgi:4-amino-4-deoxy-L-arabinose transferase-like glycosyltransferase
MASTPVRWILGGVLVAALVLHVWGIRRDLPYLPDIDEELFAVPAVTMVATGDANPHWFGHPGSTVIYPLAAIYRVWNAVAYHGPLFAADPNVRAAFGSDFGDFYLLGRLLSVAYGVLSLPLVYAIGRRVFNMRVALVGTVLTTLCPLAVAHAQMLRTDSAGTFFTMLSLWLCLKVLDEPTLRNRVLAGAAIGLAIATRYFMVTLVLVLLAVEISAWKRPTADARKRSRVEIAVSPLAIAAAFAISTPYFFLDLPTALRDLLAQNQAAHLGADGLSPAGNFLWYLTTAIPSSLTWPQAALAAIGFILSIRARQTLQWLLAAFIIVYIAAVSLSNLHWARWIIQILPVCALFAAKTLDEIAGRLSARLQASAMVQPATILSLTALVVAWPLYDMIVTDIRDSRPSTRILARQWILQHLPAGTRIAQEWYAAPLAGTGFVVSEYFSLSEKGKIESYLS